MSAGAVSMMVPDVLLGVGRQDERFHVLAAAAGVVAREAFPGLSSLGQPQLDGRLVGIQSQQRGDLGRADPVVVLFQPCVG